MWAGQIEAYTSKKHSNIFNIQFMQLYSPPCKTVKKTDSFRSACVAMEKLVGRALAALDLFQLLNIHSYFVPARQSSTSR